MIEFYFEHCSLHTVVGMKKVGVLTLFMLIAIVVFPVSVGCVEETRIEDAVKYLLHHYDDEIDLIFESEERAEHFLKEQYPNLPLTFQNVFWLYTDNYFACLALAPYSPYHSSRIKGRLENFGFRSNLYEVINGENFDIVRHGNIIYIGNFSNKYIFSLIHNGSEFDDFDAYADLCLYYALNCFFKSDLPEAEKYFQKAYKMFDGKGLKDKAFIEAGYYANYKLALLLYASRVMGIELPNYGEIESLLWSKQSENGGIVSLSDPEGNPIGSANCETTSLTLLVYNDELIKSLSEKILDRKPKIGESSLIIAAFSISLLLILLLKKIRLKRVFSYFMVRLWKTIIFGGEIA